MTVRDRQIREAMRTRERQVERALRVDALIENGDLSTHHGWGIEVKDHDGLALTWKAEQRGVAEHEVEAAYEMVREAFWRDAGDIAADHDFRGVHSAGRSGGYCLVDPQPHMDDMYETERDEYLRTRLGPWALDILDVIPSLRAMLEQELDALEPEPETSDRS